MVASVSGPASACSGAENALKCDCSTAPYTARSVTKSGMCTANVTKCRCSRGLMVNDPAWGGGRGGRVRQRKGQPALGVRTYATAQSRARQRTVGFMHASSCVSAITFLKPKSSRSNQLR